MEPDATPWEPEDFFVEGGTLEPDAPSYVTRQADRDLWQALQAGDYCNVLTARQMGKSSLMIRASSRLRAERGVRTVIIDLTAIGTEVISPNQWYLGLLGQLKRQLDLNLDEMAWWTERAQSGPVQRFSDFLRQVVLEEIEEPVVIFIDEIDSTLALPFTDDFFAAVRSAYNARAADPVYNRLTFVLLGVARPADLIKDRSRTPYNIGRSIDAGDFTADEARVLLAGLEAAYPDRAGAILERILYWTDGHPYLTQKICAQLILHENGATMGPDHIDPLVERLFLAEEARKETNLQFIQDRLRKSNVRVGMLKAYRQVLAGKQVPDEERSTAKSQLKLTGLVKATTAGYLTIRNRIYQTVFDQTWVKENMPVTTMQRVAVAAVAVAILAVLIAGYFFYEASTRSDAAQAELYTTGFAENTVSELRLSNLAGLFRLDGYAPEARDLFFALTEDEQSALFTGLSDPATSTADVVTVVQGVYQDQRLGLAAVPLLRAMAQALPQTEAENAEAHRLGLELGFWANGRAEAGYDSAEAVEQFTQALAINPDNPAVLYDRGATHVVLGDYEPAAADFEAVVGLDEARAGQVEQAVNDNPDLFTLVGQNRDRYTALAALFPTLTPTPTATNTPLPTPTFTPRPPGTPVTVNTAGQMGEVARLGNGRVNDISVSPDGEKLIIAGGLGLWFYDLETLEPLTESPLSDAAVRGMTWSPDGTQLLTWDAGDTIKTWDIGDMELLNTTKFGFVLYDDEGVVWLPDGSVRVADSFRDGVYLWSDDAPFTSIELATGHTDINTFAWSPDGGRLATAGDDYRVTVWDMENETQIREFSEGLDDDTVAWSADGERLAIGTDSFGALIWDVSSDEEQQLDSSLDEGNPKALAWSPDGSLLAIGENDVIEIWQLSTGEPVKVLEDDTDVLKDMVWTPDGQQLITTSDDNTIRIWEVETGEVLQTLEGWLEFNHMAWSPDSGRLAAGDTGGHVWVWDEVNQAVTRMPNERTRTTRDVTWLLDGFRLVAADSQGLQIWDAPGGQRVSNLDVQEGIREMAWSPDQTRFAHTGYDNDDIIYIRDAETRELLHQLSGHTERVYELVWSSDGEKLLSTNNDTRIWDAASGEQLYGLENASGPTWSPDGSQLFIGNDDNGTLQIVEATTQEIISESLLESSNASIGNPAWSPDGQTVAIGFWNSPELLLWDVNTDQPETTFTEVQGILSMAWSPGGSLLASFSNVNDPTFTVHLWDPVANQELQVLEGHKDWIRDLQWSPDGALLASLSDDGTVMVWGVDQSQVSVEEATPVEAESPTPTPAETATPSATSTPSPTPTPVDETDRLIFESIQSAGPLVADKGGFILVNCSELTVDWYIEQPRSEYRQVGIVPAFNGSHCGVSHIEGLFASFEHEFSFTAEGVRFPFRFGGIQIPAGQVAKMEISEFGPGSSITYHGIQLLGDLADLQNN